MAAQDITTRPKQRYTTTTPRQTRELYYTFTPPSGARAPRFFFFLVRFSSAPLRRFLHPAMGKTLISLFFPPRSYVYVTAFRHRADQGFGHAVYCARHAFGVGRVHNGNGRASGGADKPAENGTGGAGGEEGGDAEQQCEASSSSSGDDEESFLLVLGDHLYRRGVGTTHACADQLVHSFLAHGEAGKPAIGLKVGFLALRHIYSCWWSEKIVMTFV